MLFGICLATNRYKAILWKGTKRPGGKGESFRAGAEPTE
jgi:hypothetical protein